MGLLLCKRQIQFQNAQARTQKSQTEPHQPVRCGVFTWSGWSVYRGHHGIQGTLDRTQAGEGNIYPLPVTWWKTGVGSRLAPEIRHRYSWVASWEGENTDTQKALLFLSSILISFCNLLVFSCIKHSSLDLDELWGHSWMKMNGGVYSGQSSLVRSSQGTPRRSLEVLSSQWNCWMRNTAAASSNSTFVKITRRCSFFRMPYLPPPRNAVIH